MVIWQNLLIMNAKDQVMQSTISIFLLCLFIAFSCDSPSVKEVTIPTEENKKAAPMIQPIDSMYLTKAFVTGDFDPAIHAMFSKIDAKYADREDMYMLTEAYVAFIKMYEAALLDGVNLQIRSAARNFTYQKGIWERKWTGVTVLSDGVKANEINDPKDRALKILLYSSMPGTSRHHWGTDIDLNNFSNSYFETGEGLKLYTWLNDHAADFGFCQPYISKSAGRTGYEEEKWHWSYVPISMPLIHFYRDHVRLDDILGFKGSETAMAIDVIKNYVLGVNTNCL
jgi:LAS superfamily LD-carboxypeptidase LdcB